ncbi:MAG TPA: VRR-NUC domain-containing protein [Herpetosiphonaceae bacterium]
MEILTLDEYRQQLAPPPRRRDDEHVIQREFFQWINEAAIVEYPVLGRFYAVPNGGKRDKAVAAKLKAEGVQAGVLDTNLPFPVAPYVGLWIEFKTERGSLSKEQRDWRDFLLSAGHQVHIARSWQQAARQALEYLKADERTILRLTEGIL